MCIAHTFQVVMMILGLKNEACRKGVIRRGRLSPTAPMCLVPFFLLAAPSPRESLGSG